MLNSGGDDIRVLSGARAEPEHRVLVRPRLPALLHPRLRQHRLPPQRLAAGLAGLRRRRAGEPDPQGLPDVRPRPASRCCAGPQGTLFGRNTPAGVVKFDSVRAVAASARATSASARPLRHGQRSRARSTCRCGATGRCGYRRLSQHRDDWVDNDSRRPARASSRATTTTPRARRLLYEPARDFSALFNLHGRDLDGSARLFRANIIKPGTNDLVDGFDSRQVSHRRHERADLHTVGGSVRLSGASTRCTLHSITGYETVRVLQPRRRRRRLRRLVRAALRARASSRSRRKRPTRSATTSSSPRSSASSRAARGRSAGRPASTSSTRTYDIDAYSYDSLGGSVQTSYAAAEQKNKAWAVFGSVNYDLTPRSSCAAACATRTTRRTSATERTRRGDRHGRTAWPPAPERREGRAGTWPAPMR